MGMFVCDLETVLFWPMANLKKNQGCVSEQRVSGSTALSDACAEGSAQSLPFLQCFFRGDGRHLFFLTFNLLKKSDKAENYVGGSIPGPGPKPQVSESEKLREIKHTRNI